MPSSDVVDALTDYERGLCAAAWGEPRIAPDLCDDAEQAEWLKGYDDAE